MALRDVDRRPSADLVTAPTARSTGEPCDQPGPHPDRPATLLSTLPMLSMVIPTKNESGNISVLLTRLESLSELSRFEVIFADDSDDDTPEVIQSLSLSTNLDITMIHRSPDERDGGLGGAVVAGLRVAKGEWVCVLDADLQHPPERVQDLLNTAIQTQSDVVVASRYRDSGDVGEFNVLRRGASRASAAMARSVFPFRLRHVSDPMSGFFVVRRSKIDVDRLHPHGFKILLEILARHRALKVHEVGYQFGRRHAGESKASFSEGMTYVSQLCRLRVGEEWFRFLRFLMVGASGFVVNGVLIALITSWLGINYLISAIFASWGSTIWNFVLAEIWVFSDRSTRAHRVTRFWLFFAMNNAALAVREPMIYVMTSYLSIYYVASNFISLVALTIVRYGLSDSWIWKRAGRKKFRQESFFYDIHGIVSVRSEVWLPELERFLTIDTNVTPTLNVRIHQIGLEVQQDHATDDASHFVYDEGFGPLGFGIDVHMGEVIDIVATPLLRWSPHVLYTNVVEPILRWTFTRKGYALVHGACIAFGDDAYLVTARTDTGKTTTILRILDRQRRRSDRGSFISDDLTLLSADGHVLTYPKPLTISRHTVAAVRTPLLSRPERLALFIQSRLHSREGRQFAFKLAATGLPVATINGVVQWLVPPPKYHIQRLVPQSRVSSGAQLEGVFVIERGEDGEEVLNDRTAIEILMRNSDDAYGFPPYSVIKKRLTQFYGTELDETERSIVTEALTGLNANLVRSSSMNWSQRIPELAGITQEERERLSAVEKPALSPA